MVGWPFLWNSVFCIEGVTPPHDASLQPSASLPPLYTTKGAAATGAGGIPDAWSGAQRAAGIPGMTGCPALAAIAAGSLAPLCDAWADCGGVVGAELIGSLLCKLSLLSLLMGLHP